MASAVASSFAHDTCAWKAIGLPSPPASLNASTTGRRASTGRVDGDESVGPRADHAGCVGGDGCPDEQRRGRRAGSRRAHDPRARDRRGSPPRRAAARGSRRRTRGAWRPARPLRATGRRSRARSRLPPSRGRPRSVRGTCRPAWRSPGRSRRGDSAAPGRSRRRRGGRSPEGRRPARTMRSRNGPGVHSRARGDQSTSPHRSRPPLRGDHRSQQRARGELLVRSMESDRGHRAVPYPRAGSRTPPGSAGLP